MTFEAGVPVALDGERLELVELLERAAADRRPPRRRDRRPHRGPHRGPQGPRHLRGAGSGDPAARPPASWRSWCAPSTRTSSSPGSTASGPTWCTPACGGSRCAATSTPTRSAVNRQVSGTITVRLFKGSVRVVGRESPNAVYDQALAGFGESGGLFSQHASPGFIELWSLQSRMAHRLREGDEPRLNPRPPVAAAGAREAAQRRVTPALSGAAGTARRQPRGPGPRLRLRWPTAGPRSAAPGGRRETWPHRSRPPSPGRRAGTRRKRRGQRRGRAPPEHHHLPRRWRWRRRHLAGPREVDVERLVGVARPDDQPPFARVAEDAATARQSAAAAAARAP